MATFHEIEQQTKEYAAARKDLRDRVLGLNDEIEKIKRQRLPGIKKAAEMAGTAHVALRLKLEESPELFKRPRTITIHGIKVGFQKLVGELSWVDDAAVVKAIKKLLPDGWDAYIKVTEKPLKKPLAGLPAAELKKCGITVSNDTDEVLIKSTDSDIDKLVAAMLKEETEQDQDN